MDVEEVTADRLHEYARVPSAFTVESVLAVRPLEAGLGGLRLHEEPVTPYRKDYDALGETPLDWPRLFDVRNWGFLLATDGGPAVGGAAVAFHTAGVDMLEGRPDLAVLWDIRVDPARRGQGIGKLLFHRAVEWSRRRGCTRMKIETQNVNVPACRFYRAMGCTLGSIHRHGYSDPRVAHEAMLLWYLDLQAPTTSPSTPARAGGGLP